jgi:putative protein-disulfide isomerase
MEKLVKEENKIAPVLITYYTDPLCCWSWAMDKYIDKIIDDFDGQISMKYCLSGLIPDWSGYHDELNSISRPVQMGPLWMYAEHMCDVPMKSTIWYTDPPSSSYPPCIAVKTVELQSATAAEMYLKILRQALMIEGLNISKETVILSLARRLAEKSFDFDYSKFEHAYKNGDGFESFRQDLNEVHLKNIVRVPTLIINNSKNGIILTGFRSYSTLKDAITLMMGNKLMSA